MPFASFLYVLSETSDNYTAIFPYSPDECLEFRIVACSIDPMTEGHAYKYIFDIIWHQSGMLEVLSCDWEDSIVVSKVVNVYQVLIDAGVVYKS
jgi:hypothetical protein